MTSVADYLVRHRNDEFPIYIVQDQPVDWSVWEGVPPDDPCGCGVDFTKSIYSGLGLERSEALHLARHHCFTPNLSICRFSSHARGDYAVDLIWEIDAHGDLPEDPLAEHYVDAVRAAVDVGRHIFNWLVEFGVWPGFITTTVTRMGARVTCDWRAFGPKRLHQVQLVARYVEEKAVGTAIQELRFVHRIPSLEVDYSIYRASDRLRGAKSHFQGKWLRPPLARHAKSTPGLEFYTLPVPHSRFHPEHAELLVRLSRFSLTTTGWESLTPKAIDFATRSPESRDPRYDHLIEDHPRGVVCEALLGLFEKELALVADIPQDEALAHQATWLRANGPKIKTGGYAELSDEDVRDIAGTLGPFRDRGDKLVFETCPRTACKGGHSKGKTEIVEGMFHCFKGSCETWRPLAQVAREEGYGNLVPLRRHSTSTVALIAGAEAPPVLNPWDESRYAVMDRVFETIEQAVSDREKAIAQFVESDDDVFVDLSPTGTGKSTTVRNYIQGMEGRARIFVPREDSKSEFMLALPDAVSIKGRRFGENCMNPVINDDSLKWDRTSEAICQRCHLRKECSYLAQFEGVPGHHVVACHPYALMQLRAMDNDSRLDVIDEDPTNQLIDSRTFDTSELPSLGCIPTPVVDEHEDEGGGISVDPTGEFVSAPASTRIHAMLVALQRCLTSDHLMESATDLANQPFLADRVLEKALCGSAVLGEQLRKSIEAVSDADLDSFESLRRGAIAGLGPLKFEIHPDEARRIWESSSGLEDYLDQLAEKRTPVFLEADICMPGVPPNALGLLVNALRGLVARDRATTPLLVYRHNEQWRLQLDRKREVEELEPPKTIIMSATMTPLRVRLLTPGRRVRVYRATLTKREERIVVPDKSFSRASLDRGKGHIKGRHFETVEALIRVEYERTKLPVAVLGTSAVINEFNRHMLKNVPKELLFPFKATERESKNEALKNLTVEKGYISGCVHSVTGSNMFQVGGSFVRTVILIHNPIPNLAGFARAAHGLFSDIVDFYDDGVPLDWTPVLRPMTFPGSHKNDVAIVATNVPSFADSRAQEWLIGAYQGAALQAIGRLRPNVGTKGPIPRVYLFGALPLPEWPVDRYTGYEELRKDLGLSTRSQKRGRPPVVSLARVRKDGIKSVLTRAVTYYVERGDTSPVRAAERAFLSAGMEFPRERAMQARHIWDGLVGREKYCPDDHPEKLHYI